jgi:predicted CXXCH cytochrome family protein
MPRRLWLVPLMLVLSLTGAVLAADPFATGLTPSATARFSDKLSAALGPAYSAPGSAAHMSAQQCASCHQVDSTFSHPTGVRPSFAVPAAFPLSQGAIACTTCHLDTASAHAEARQNGSFLLRGTADNSAFCYNCHASNEMTSQAQHPMATGFAHLQWPRQAGRSVHTLSAGDDGSRSCLMCHDGTVASDSFGGATGLPGQRHATGGHPTSVAYSPSARNGGDGWALRPAGTLDARLRLFNGQVGCATCHSPYSRQEKLLVMDNHSSKMCLSCHEMN